MNRLLCRLPSLAVLLLLFHAPGCIPDLKTSEEGGKPFVSIESPGGSPKRQPPADEKNSAPPKQEEPTPKKLEFGKPFDPKSVPGKVGELGKNVYLNTLPDGKRRVIINAYVCLREGQLELLLCRKMTKEHEAILAADIDARVVHAGLLASGAKPGSPVHYRPKYRPAHGSVIKVTLEYRGKDGKTVSVPAQQWILNVRTKKQMEHDWVFAGSQFQQLEPDQPPYYAANGGDVICVSNFETAMLDLPVELPNENNQLVFDAFTERIPPLGSQVLVILEPVPERKK